jgi:hypothetical protein
MELIIAIFFFSLASGVCVRLFSYAHILSEKSININNAVTWSQNLSEAFYGSKADLGVLSTLYPQAFVSSADEDKTTNSVMLFFNENWEFNEAGLVNASYEALLETEKLPASEVYSDVNEYGVWLQGDAIVGNIIVIDLKGTSEVFTSFPEDEQRIIYSGKIDMYLGKEGQ